MMPGAEECGLAGLERESVEHHRDDHADVLGEVLGDLERRDVGALDVDALIGQRLAGRPDLGQLVGRRRFVEQLLDQLDDAREARRGAQAVGEPSRHRCVDAAQHPQDLRRGPESDERVEGRERVGHLGLVVRVLVGPLRCVERYARGLLGLESLARHLPVGMHLQRQRPVGSEELDQERQVAGGVGERGAVVVGRRRERVRADPHLGDRLAVGLVARGTAGSPPSIPSRSHGTC